MIAKKSPLKLLNSLLLKQTFDFVPHEEKTGIKINEIFDSYPIEIDFAVQNNPKPYYQIFVKISVNMMEQRLPGYSLFIEGVSIFEIEKSITNNDKMINDLIYLSGVPFCINNLRSIISLITASGPMGKYTLPSIDLNELLKEKGLVNSQKTKK